MARRERSFPITFEITKPTRYSPGGCEMYYAHEWEALQKSRQAGQYAQPPSDEPAQAADGLAQTTDESTQANDQPADGGLPEEAGQPPEAIEATSDATPSVALRASESFASSTSSASSTSLPSSRPPDFYRHARRCNICSHPDRDAIEGDFIRWRSPRDIAKDYHLADHNSIYRHVHATGLFSRRRREFCRVLENLLEYVDHVTMDAAPIIVSASRVYAHLDDEGRWYEPPRTNIVLTGSADRAATGFPPVYTEPGKPGERARRQGGSAPAVAEEPGETDSSLASETTIHEGGEEKANRDTN